MKYAFAVAALAAVASAQTLPSCALTCATGAVAQSGGCALTDTACLCKSQAYLAAYASCVASSCSPADQQTATTVGLQLCANAGVTITATPSVTSSATNSAESSSASASASSAASSVSASASSSSSAAASSASKSSTSESSSASSSASSASKSASSASSSASATMSSASASASSAASSASSSGIAPTQAITWEVLGLGAAAVAALL